MGSNPAHALDNSRLSRDDLDLLLRETNHRCNNDLQLIVSLLALQSRRAVNPEVREALNDAMERVSVLARARSVLHGTKPTNLNAALREVCKALNAQAEPRSIDVTFEAKTEVASLSATQITTLALVVNELATNAIKHAFEEDKSGSVRVMVNANGRGVTVIVDDDGLPFPELEGNVSGLGMGLVKRMVASIDGLLILPPPGTKTFELRIPVN